MTNASAISICAPVGGFGHPNGSMSASSSSPSGTGISTGNGNWTGMGRPVPFIGAAASTGLDVVALIVVLAGTVGKIL